MLIAIVDPGSGNLHSVERAIAHASSMQARPSSIVTTRDPEVIRRADRVVLPGQGAFAACRAGLDSIPGMLDALSDFVLRRQRPFLGICVGMQLLAERGIEHALTPGFGWLRGQIGPINPRSEEGVDLPLPHMGWNRLEARQSHPLMKGLDPRAHAYFVHSFAWTGGDVTDVLAGTNYGGDVIAMVGRGNLAGTQFHVEKSGQTGLTILKNFLSWTP